MEEVIFVQRRDRRSHPQVLRVRDNGEYEVEDTGSPSPRAVLIGQFREVLCFRDSDRSSFLVWNFRTKTLEKEFGFSTADPNAEAVAGFAKTVAGEVRIVLVARSGLSFSTRVCRGEEDERGLEEEGGHGKQEPRPENGSSVLPPFEHLQQKTRSADLLCLLEEHIEYREDHSSSSCRGGVVRGTDNSLHFHPSTGAISPRELGMVKEQDS